jgi:hypothetical protein
MFLNVDKHNQAKTAIKDDSGYSLTYGDACRTIREFDDLKLPRSVIFCLCENCAGSLIGYMAFENNRQVPLLLSAGLDEGLRTNLENMYTPSYYWVPERKSGEIGGEKIYEAYGYVLLKTDFPKEYPLYDELGLLLTTSGSTGSPKFVRQSYANILDNAQSIVQYLKLSADERPITTLPMNYTYGLSIINSHLLVGAAILMTEKGLMQTEFWSFFREAGATSFGGVPYTYEMLEKLSAALDEMKE